MAIISIVSKISGELRGQPGAPGEQESTLAAGSSLGPHLDKTSENGLFFLEFFSTTWGEDSQGFSVFYSLFVREGTVLVKYVVLPDLVKNLMLQKDIITDTVLHPPHTEWDSASSSLRSVQ